jgi:hypothetical protein
MTENSRNEKARFINHRIEKQKVIYIPRMTESFP